MKQRRALTSADLKSVGGITIHGNRFQITFYLHGIKCRESVKLTLTRKNLNHVIGKRAAIIHEIAIGSFDYTKHFPNSNSKFAKMFANANAKKRVLFKDWIDDWLDGHKAQITVTTHTDYKKIIKKHLKPEFGEHYLDAITVSLIKKWRGNLGVTAKTANNICTPLRLALRQAKLDKVIDDDPMSYIKNLKHRADEPDPFSIEEMHRLLAACKEPQVRNYLQFAFWSGLRQTELVELRWSDIDLEAGVIRVARARVRGQVKNCKTDNSDREVKLLSHARAALVDQKKYTYLKGEYVFENPRINKRWNNDQSLRQNYYAHAMKKAGLRYRPPRQTRHTYASLLLSAGESPMFVAKQMGHADWGMIRKRYGRWIPSTDPHAGSRAEQLVEQFNAAHVQQSH